MKETKILSFLFSVHQEPLRTAPSAAGNSQLVWWLPFLALLQLTLYNKKKEKNKDALMVISLPAPVSSVWYILIHVIHTLVVVKSST